RRSHDQPRPPLQATGVGRAITSTTAHTGCPTSAVKIPTAALRPQPSLKKASSGGTNRHALWVEVWNGGEDASVLREARNEDRRRAVMLRSDVVPRILTDHAWRGDGAVFAKRGGEL